MAAEPADAPEGVAPALDAPIGKVETVQSSRDYSFYNMKRGDKFTEPRYNPKIIFEKTPIKPEGTHPTNIYKQIPITRLKFIPYDAIKYDDIGKRWTTGNYNAGDHFDHTRLNTLDKYSKFYHSDQFVRYDKPLPLFVPDNKIHLNSPRGLEEQWRLFSAATGVSRKAATKVIQQTARQGGVVGVVDGDAEAVGMEKVEEVEDAESETALVVKDVNAAFAEREKGMEGMEHLAEIKAEHDTAWKKINAIRKDTTKDDATKAVQIRTVRDRLNAKDEAWTASKEGQIKVHKSISEDEANLKKDIAKFTTEKNKAMVDMLEQASARLQEIKKIKTADAKEKALAAWNVRIRAEIQALEEAERKGKLEEDLAAEEQQKQIAADGIASMKASDLAKVNSELAALDHDDTTRYGKGRLIQLLREWRETIESTTDDPLAVFERLQTIDEEITIERGKTAKPPAPAPTPAPSPTKLTPIQLKTIDEADTMIESLSSFQHMQELKRAANRKEILGKLILAGYEAGITRSGGKQTVNFMKWDTERTILKKVDREDVMAFIKSQGWLA